MNYASKFDAKLPADGSGLHSNGHGHVETITSHATHAPSDAIIVPDAQLLFNGDFKRSGVDLVLSRDGHELVLQDYFRGQKHAALASPDGAHLTGDIVDALTGHVQYAQADGSGAFSIKGVAPGEYEVSAWHENASKPTTRKVTVSREGAKLSLTVAGDKQPSAYPPDKYGKPRQQQIGY